MEKLEEVLEKLLKKKKKKSARTCWRRRDPMVGTNLAYFISREGWRHSHHAPRARPLTTCPSGRAMWLRDGMWVYRKILYEKAFFFLESFFLKAFLEGFFGKFFCKRLLKLSKRLSEINKRLSELLKRLSELSKRLELRASSRNCVAC